MHNSRGVWPLRIKIWYVWAWWRCSIRIWRCSSRMGGFDFWGSTLFAPWIFLNLCWKRSICACFFVACDELQRTFKWWEKRLAAACVKICMCILEVTKYVYQCKVLFCDYILLLLKYNILKLDQHNLSHSKYGGFIF